MCVLSGACTDPATNTAYMAITRIDKGMLKGSSMDGLGPDHIQLEANPCGVIMALKLNKDFQATSAQVRRVFGVNLGLEPAHNRPWLSGQQ